MDKSSKKWSCFFKFTVFFPKVTLVVFFLHILYFISFTINMMICVSWMPLLSGEELPVIMLWNMCASITLYMITLRVCRFYGVMVSTLDSESTDSSSNIGRTYIFNNSNYVYFAYRWYIFLPKYAHKCEILWLHINGHILS